MVTGLIFAICFAVAATDGSEICAGILKALLGARHEEFHRDFVSVKRDLHKIKKEFKTFQDQLQNKGSGKGQGAYIRWGRTACPKGASVVYKGYAGGQHYTHNSGSSKPICLPEKPQYGAYKSGLQNNGLVYGTEYETNYFPPLKTVHDGDVPCVVCKTTRTAVIMIPARKQCTKGWSREYHGYLMSGHYNRHSAADYICVDSKPETIKGGNGNQNHNPLYMVEGRCGSLKCPPYNSYKELTCVVCSA